MTSFEGNSFLGLINRLRGAFYHRSDTTMTVSGLRVGNAATAKTTDYTMLASDFFVAVTCSTVDITITLPAVAEFTGQLYAIFKNDATSYAVIIDGNGSELINGAATYRMDAQRDTVILEAGTVGWRIIAKSSGSGATSPYMAKTANYTLVAADGTINATANSFTLTLPTAVGAIGRVYNLKNSGNGIITIATTSSQTIDGNASGVLKLVQYDNLTVQSNGANWIIL